jgi:hypothetical protein
MAALTDETRYRCQLKEATEKAVDTGSLAKEQEARVARVKEMASQHHELAATAEQSLENLKSQVLKEFKNRECINALRKLFDGIARRIVPKVVQGPNIFQQFLQPQFVFADDKRDLLQSQPASLAESLWRNFLEYCDKKITVARDAAEKGAEATEIKGFLRGCDEELEGMRRQLKDLALHQSEVTDKLLLTRVNLHVPFTFRQGQVEIPSDIVIIDYSDVCLIDKKVVMDRNKLILDAGKRKLDELENIRQQKRNHEILKWEIKKCRVDVENLNEEVKEYQLFRVTKMDMELIMGGGKNRNQTEVNSLNNSLQHMQKTHEVRLRRANASLKKLKRKVTRKTAENAKIEEEILRMQLGLKERKRIYNIQMKSSEGVQEARKNRLRQVMTISRLKRMLHVQGLQIGDLKTEVARLRKCVYTSFNDGDDFEAIVGYNTGVENVRIQGTGSKVGRA